MYLLNDEYRKLEFNHHALQTAKSLIEDNCSMSHKVSQFSSRDNDSLLKRVIKNDGFN